MSDEKDETGETETLVDEQRRQFLKTSAVALGGLGALCALMPFVSSWMPSAKTKSQGAPVTVDLRQIKPGEQLVKAWRGKPVWIIHRTPGMLQQLKTHIADLRDPDSRVAQQPDYAKNQFRSINPKYLVLIGICTHLGCTPKYQSTENQTTSTNASGFFCPCHGSRFDLSGRVFKSMPAPINMQVPPYRFINDHTILIGEDEHA